MLLIGTFRTQRITGMTMDKSKGATTSYIMAVLDETTSDLG